MLIQKPNIYKCDLCDREVESISYPDDFCKLNQRMERSGFYWSGSCDICEVCAPKSMFRDPPIKIALKPNVLIRAIKFLSSKMSKTVSD